jgi:hypothetical protein
MCLTFADGASTTPTLPACSRSAACSPRFDCTVFETVAVDHEFGTIVWPEEVDLDADVLRGGRPPASGAASPVGHPARLSAKPQILKLCAVSRARSSALRKSPRIERSCHGARPDEATREGAAASCGMAFSR